MNQPSFHGLTVVSFESRMAADMARLIERYGGRAIVAPALREVPLERNPEALAFGERLLAERIDLLILLTGVGTKALVEVLRTRYPLESIRGALARVALVARGPKPAAALRELGLAPTLSVPEPNTWHDVVHTLDYYKPVRGLRIAVQEYGVPNPDLVQALKGRGAEVLPVPVYRWALPEDTGPLRRTLDQILAGEAEVLLVTNAAQIEHVMQWLERDDLTGRFEHACARMVVASIGPTASERLRSYGLPVDLEPSHPKMGILVKEAAERAGELLRAKRGSPGAPAETG